jgi:hypothetical protein
MPHGAPVRFAQRTAQRPGLMGFSPGLWLRFVARRFGIENPRRRDAGNEYNHSLSRMVKLRRKQRRVCTAIALACGAPQNDKTSSATSTRLNVPNASTATSKTRVKLIIVSPDTRQPGKMVELSREEVYAVCASAPDDGRLRTQTAIDWEGRLRSRDHLSQHR